MKFLEHLFLLGGGLGIILGGMHDMVGLSYVDISNNCGSALCSSEERYLRDLHFCLPPEYQNNVIVRLDNQCGSVIEDRYVKLDVSNRSFEQVRDILQNTIEAEKAADSSDVFEAKKQSLRQAVHEKISQKILFDSLLYVAIFVGIVGVYFFQWRQARKASMASPPPP